MRIAILDECHQDIGIKLLFPDADYYVCDIRENSKEICKKHSIVYNTSVIENVTDKKYDVLFVVICLYNAMKFYTDKGDLHHNYLKQVGDNFIKIVDIINNNNFYNVSLFLLCDIDYDPNMIYTQYSIQKKLLFFKRNMNIANKYGNNVIPFPYIIFNRGLFNIIDSLSLLHSAVPTSDKYSVVCFSGSLYVHTDLIFGKEEYVRDRLNMFNRIKVRFGNIIYYLQNYNHTEYISEMAKSKYCLDLVGAGDPNLRTFEILHANTLLISQRTGLRWNFEDGDDFCEETYFSDEDELVRKIERLDADMQLYERCLEQQRRLVQKYMTKGALCLYICKKMLQFTVFDISNVGLKR